MDKNFWNGKKVLITGNTGFKGTWLTEILLSCNAEVFGYALENDCPESIYNVLNTQQRIESCIGDICDEQKLFDFIDKIKPEIVFHLAAQPIVRYSYKEPLETYRTNVIGTATLFECIKKIDSVKAVVNITTDKIYENNDKHEPFKEGDHLGGYDPYSASKACSEIVTSSYVNSFFNPEDYNKTHHTAIATARAGNVIGGGDFAPDRLIPDCIRAVRNNEKVLLRNPNSVRPWQNVLEPLALYILLAEKLYNHGTEFNGAWNIGPDYEDCLSVIEVLKKFRQYIPNLDFEILPNDNKQLHEAEMLKLNSEKAKKQLSFENRWNINNAVKYTAIWYQAQLNNENMYDVTSQIIKEYFNL